MVACSGGLDSRVLLDLACRSGVPVHVIHVHHGLQLEADEWADQVAALANHLAVSCEILRVAVNAADGGIEAAARKARYAALRQALRAGDCLVTGHHADDQVETLLLRLLRGTGPSGLAGIRYCKPFGPGYLLRPLLSQPYSALRRYAEAQRLEWIEDPSNQSLAHERNFLRHRVLVSLQERWPALHRAVGRLARLSDENNQVLHALLSERLERHYLPGTHLLRVHQLAGESVAMRHALLRQWITEFAWRPPGEQQLRQGLDQLLTARADRHPALRWQDGMIIRFNGLLFRLPSELPTCPGPCRINRGQRVAWGDLGDVFWPEEALPEQPNTLGLRGFQPGDHLHEANRPRQKIKELLRKAGVPPWWRACLPVAVAGDAAPVAVAGVAPMESLEFTPVSDSNRADWRYWHV